MRDALLALLTGFTVGTVFVIAGLPIPAPPTIAGVCGIVGITLAFIIIGHYRGS
jgi:XapX domain-containing protein